MVTKDKCKQLKQGDKVKVKLNGALVDAEFFGWNARYDMPNVKVDGKILPRRVHAIVTSTESAHPGAANPATATGAAPLPAACDVPINVRFQYLEQLVALVATSVPTSLVVVGPGGLGKSYTVFQTLRQLSLEEDYDFVVVKGSATAKSLYRALFENRDKILVFDDCDAVLKDWVAVNLLKAALDTSCRRSVSWRCERDDGSLPQSFNFEGKIIFISNLRLSQIPQAILSRALHVDVSMTMDEKLARMRHIAPNICPELALDKKLELLDVLYELRHECQDLNLRTLLKLCAIRQTDTPNWRELAKYVVRSGSAALAEAGEL
jgi:hypothetical protein